MSVTSNLSAEEALKLLVEGNNRFVESKENPQNRDSKRRMSLEGGQAPSAIILSCADSRVVPELLFDTGLGDIFIIRVAGNIANTSSIASIEYAVAHLGVNLIMVLGHESCGAVTAAVNGGDNGHNLNHLVSHIVPAVSACKGDDINTVVKKNAELTTEELLNRSTIISGAKQDRGLKVIPAYYNLGTGKVDLL